jgi:hypothetical protein
MSIHTFVDDFVRSENEIYSYSKKDRNGIKRRLKSSLNQFIENREKNIRNQNYYLMRKNKKLENDYDILSNIAVTSMNKTIENDLVKNNEDEDVDEFVDEDEYLDEERHEGYTAVVWSFIRMLIMIYLSLLIVYVYDVITENTTTNALTLSEEKKMLEWK